MKISKTIIVFLSSLFALIPVLAFPMPQQTLSELVAKESGVSFGECRLNPRPQIDGDRIVAVIPARFEDPSVWQTNDLLLVGESSGSVLGVLELKLPARFNPKEVSLSCHGDKISIRGSAGASKIALHEYAWDGKTFGSPSAKKRPPESSNTPISEGNWKTHPSIVEIRNIYQEVQTGIKEGNFKVSKRTFEDCGVAIDTFRQIAKNAQGEVRMFSRKNHSESSECVYEYYYDETAQLRFVLLQCTGEQAATVRTYWSPNGKLLWEDKSDPLAPEARRVLDPASAFAAANACRAKRYQ